MDEYTTVAEVMAAYKDGDRFFFGVQIDEAVFHRRDLSDANFLQVAFRAADFNDASMRGVTFVGSDLTGATLKRAHLVEADLNWSVLSGAKLTKSNLDGARFADVVLTGADLTGCNLSEAFFRSTDLDSAVVDRVTLNRTTFADADVSTFCDAAAVTHRGPSYVDFRSVLRSCHHPGLKRFLVDCGVPPVVAEYTVAAAEAEGSLLRSLMRSTFISYGGPDEAFARRLYEELRAHGAAPFFFPETAQLGRRIGDEVHSRIREHDRVILVCSRDSLDRPGVRNEIQETFDREARDGGATYLLPIMLDDYVLTGWDDPLAERVRGRVVGDFRGAMTDSAAFDRAMHRLLAALRKEPS